MYCSKCGNLLKEEDNFCNICGTPAKTELEKMQEASADFTIVKDDIPVGINDFFSFDKEGEIIQQKVDNEYDEIQKKAIANLAYSRSTSPAARRAARSERRGQDKGNDKSKDITVSVENIEATYDKNEITLTETIQLKKANDEDFFGNDTKVKPQTAKKSIFHLGKKEKDIEIYDEPNVFTEIAKNLSVGEDFIQSIQVAPAQDAEIAKNLSDQNTLTTETHVGATIDAQIDASPVGATIGRPNPDTQVTETHVGADIIRPTPTPDDTPTLSVEPENVEYNPIFIGRRTNNKYNTPDEAYEYFRYTRSKAKRKPSIFMIIIAIILVIIVAAGIRMAILGDTPTDVINNIKAVFAERMSQQNVNINNQKDIATKEFEEVPNTLAESAIVEDPIVTKAKAQSAGQTMIDYLLKAGINKNIIEVTYNPALKHVSGKKYKAEDITYSATLTNNLWKEENAETFYINEAIMSTIISYNSSWIDFVNEGKKDVLNYTKKGGAAQLNVLNFGKKNFTEKFIKLELGEIRKGKNGYYIWTKENINVIEGTQTSSVEYSWIYYLEEIDNQFKIVAYYNYN